jgi:cytochrome c oxidase subunit 2
MKPGSDRTHALRLLIAWAILSAIAVVLVLTLLDLPPGDLTRQGTDESQTMNLMTVLAAPVFVGVVLYLLYAGLVWRRPAGDLPTTDGPPAFGFLPLQLGWVIGTGVVVLLLAVVGISTLSSSQAATIFGAPGRAIGNGETGGGETISGPETNPLKVQVIGQQWYFTYRYLDYGIETNHLMLPVHRNIELHITSTDITHSFWAYELGVKADANPGVDNEVELGTEKTGSFQVRCAELCGIWHGSMQDPNGRILSQQEFDAWVKQEQAAQQDLAPLLPSPEPFYFPKPLTKGH